MGLISSQHRGRRAGHQRDQIPRTKHSWGLLDTLLMRPLMNFKRGTVVPQGHGAAPTQVWVTGACSGP